MPRQNRFTMTLSPAEEPELRQRAATYTAPYVGVVRARIILMAAEGLQNLDIAEQLMLPVRIITKWRKRHYHEGLAGLDERPRPRRLSARNISSADARR